MAFAWENDSKKFGRINMVNPVCGKTTLTTSMICFIHLPRIDEVAFAQTKSIHTTTAVLMLFS